MSNPLRHFLNLTLPAFALFAFLLSVPGAASAQEETIHVFRPGFRKIGVAVVDFAVDGVPPEMGRDVASVIRSDLEWSEFFKVLAPEKNPPQPGNHLPEEQNFAPWKETGITAYVRGLVKLEADDKISIEARLYDVKLEQFRTGKRYQANPRYLRQMAHRFSNTVTEDLAGVEGIYTTKIAFVSDETGTREMMIMDIDGFNREALTKNRSINSAPRWTPDGKSLMFVSYRRGKPDLYKFDLLGRVADLFWDRGELNMSGSWSPDGTKVLVSQSSGANAQIYLIENNGERVRQLTTGTGLNLSPSWSPDGKEIAYVSDRTGSPQVYIMNSEGENMRRLTTYGNYNTSPAWSPKGDRIAFVRREARGFNVYAVNPDGSDEVLISKEGGANEDPTWSPRGDFLIYSSKRNKNYDLILSDAFGERRRAITKTPSNEIQPAWSPRDPK